MREPAHSSEHNHDRVPLLLSSGIVIGRIGSTIVRPVLAELSKHELNNEIVEGGQIVKNYQRYIYMYSHDLSRRKNLVKIILLSK